MYTALIFFCYTLPGEHVNLYATVTENAYKKHEIIIFLSWKLLVRSVVIVTKKCAVALLNINMMRDEMFSNESFIIKKK